MKNKKETFELNRLGGFYGQATRWGVYDPKHIAPTLVAAAGMGGGHTVMILEKTDERKQNN